MSDSHTDAHHGPDLKTYMLVFGALSVFTAVSFIVNALVHNKPAAMAIILAVAFVKAILVGLYFMHLIVDWPRLYYFIFPTFILAAMMLVVLLPDIVLGW